jgi:hypothetical protein
MVKCYGIIVTKNHVNYNKQCSINCKTSKYCTQHCYQRNNHDYCIIFIKLYLGLIQNTPDTLNKTKLCHTLFKYLVFNKDFIDKNNNFKTILIKKIDDFIILNNLQEFMIYKKALLSK